ncbi:MAG: hypothetical protein CM15mP120_19290 [Pseudomonadota bacterium]|nr:MAG: hypothetical protein CM15mP120_19290 [Pseudomonadota bacterium]
MNVPQALWFFGTATYGTRIIRVPLDGERVVCHVTYSRLMMRPVENYSFSQGAIN